MMNLEGPELETFDLFHQIIGGKLIYVVVNATHSLYMKPTDADNIYNYVYVDIILAIETRHQTRHLYFNNMHS